MRLLFATSTDFSNDKQTGAHKRFLELLNAVADRASVQLVAMSLPSENIAKDSFFPVKKSHLVFLPKHIVGMFELCKTIKKNKRLIHYDFAVSFSPETTIAYKLAGIQHIVTLLRENFIDYKKVIGVSRFKLKYFEWQERISVLVSEKIIVQCENDKSCLIERNEKYRKDIDQITFIQINNVNASWMQEPPVRQNNSDGDIKILFIGDFSNKRKGHSILLPAIARLLDEQYRVTLYVAGDGVELNEYKQKYERYTDIVFLGRIDNVLNYLSRCDFEIVPSLIDSCPNTVLEALAAGVAVYGTNIGGIPDLLVEPRYMFEPNEESAYLFIKEILDCKRYYEDANNQKLLKERLTFDWPKQIMRIIEQ